MQSISYIICASTFCKYILAPLLGPLRRLLCSLVLRLRCFATWVSSLHRPRPESLPPPPPPPPRVPASPGIDGASLVHFTLASIPAGQVSFEGIQAAPTVGLPVGITTECVRRFLGDRLDASQQTFVEDLASVGTPMEASDMTRECAARLLWHFLRPLPLLDLGVTWLRDADAAVVLCSVSISASSGRTMMPARRYCTLLAL